MKQIISHWHFRHQKLKWTTTGQLEIVPLILTEDHETNKASYFYSQKDIAKIILGYNAGNDHVISVRFFRQPFNVAVIQIYFPTTDADNEVADEFGRRHQ